MSQSLVLHRPRSVDEAVQLLEQHGDEAKVVAGATALSIMLREHLISPGVLVSLDGIPGLRAIEVDDSSLRIGACVTHRQVELSPIVRAGWPVLAETFTKVGNVRVRNAATVGGVLAEADYASDPPAVFIALDAEIQVTGPRGVRWVAANEFFVGFYETILAADEIVTAVRVPALGERTGAVYEKVVTRSVEDRPSLGVAAVVSVGEDRQTCTRLRVAVGAASETPVRLPDVEALGEGKRLSNELVKTIADGYAARVDTLTDVRSSAWYRTEMIRVWVERTVERGQALGLAPRPTR
jgi:carbon-monoxide dehydrogenase medium subunit